MRTLFIITVSLWFAVVAMLVPQTKMSWLHIDWTMLVLIFWLLHAARYTGVLIACSLGIILDVLLDFSLGQYTLTFVVIAYLVDLLRARMQLFMLWQYSITLLILISTGNMVLFASHFLLNNTFDGWQYVITVCSSFCCYPLVHLTLWRIHCAYANK